MNVQQLIDALTHVEDKTLEVSIEGCDCINRIKNVSIQDWLDEQTVLIEADL